MQFESTQALVSAFVPFIPHLLMALSSWAALITVVFLMNRRFSDVITVLLLIAALPVQIMLRCIRFDAVPPSLFFLTMLLLNGFMLLCILLLTKGSRPTCVFAWMLSFMISEFTASLIWQVCCMLLERPTMRDPRLALGILMMLALINGGIWLFVYRFEETIQIPYASSAWMAVGVSLLIFLLGNIYVFQVDRWMDSAARDMREMIGWIRTAAEMSGIVLLWLLLRISRERVLQDELKTMDHLMDAQYRQYLSYRDSSDYIRRQCHDLKHQIQTLRDNWTGEQREAYLDEMERVVERYQAQCDTGNKVLDTILTQFLLHCGERGITIEHHVAAESLRTMEIRDICSVFGNLLDNAMDAVSQLSPQERIIHLNVEQRSGFVSICIENRCDQPLQFKNGLPLTTKKSKGLHGIGLSSIRYTVEKYGGSVQLEAQDGWFTAAILIPLQMPDQTVRIEV